MSKATRDFVTGYLTAQGVPAHVAAGIAGNLAVESDNFHPDVISGKRTGDKGRSKYGFQWNDTRLENFEAYAREHNRDPRDILTQVDFMMAEVNPRSKYADPQAVKGATAIFGAQNPEQAAEAFSRHYERPSYPNMNGRKTAAVQAYEGWFSARTTNAPTPYGRDEDPLAAAPQTASLVEAAPTGYTSPLGPQGDRITSGFGLRSAPATQGGRRGTTNHAGIDMTAAAAQGVSGYPAMTVAPGHVSFAGWAGNYGNMVEISHLDGSKTRYAHLDKINPSLTKDTPVARGIPVGTVGTTGNSSAEHLHFEMIDPLGNRINPASMIDFAQNRTVPTPTPAQRDPVQLAGRIPGVPTTVTPTVSVPGAAPAFTAASDFGINMGKYGQLAGVPASMVQSTTIAPGAQMASLNQPSAPSARSAQEQSMAAYQAGQEQYANDRVTQAFSAPSPTSDLADNRVAAAHAVGSFTPSPRSAEDYSMTAFAASQPAQTATEALDALAGPEDEQIDMGSWGQVTQAAPQSITMAPTLAPPQSIPSLQQAPVTYSVPAAAPAPVSRAPAPSMPSGLDFWGGKANVAVSNSGAQLSRDIHGNTYNYSPSYDVTTISNSLGDVIGTQQGKVSIDATGNPSGGKGLFSGGIFGDDGVFGDTFSKGGFQNAVVGGLGGLGGSIVGGMVGGPIGGIVGSALGRSLAQSRFGVPAVNPMAITPQQMAAALASYSGGLAFPDAPTGGAGWGGWVDGSGPGSRGYAESISPGATAAIDAGKGGLY